VKGLWTKAVGERAPEPRTDRPDITASQISDFSYCARSWWLRRVEGIVAETAETAAGTRAHGLVGDLVAESVVIERLVRLCAGLLLLIAGLIGCLWLVR
jgi:CRISPR/Cas system-associated exonuclease Cas4 (RecB family)